MEYNPDLYILYTTNIILLVYIIHYIRHNYIRIHYKYLPLCDSIKRLSDKQVGSLLSVNYNHNFIE